MVSPRSSCASGRRCLLPADQNCEGDGEEDSIDGDERANAHASVALAVRFACSLCRPASFAAALNVAKGLVLGALRSAANWSGAPRRCVGRNCGPAFLRCAFFSQGDGGEARRKRVSRQGGRAAVSGSATRRAAAGPIPSLPAGSAAGRAAKS
jgi:hypothetical protein